DLLAAGAGLPGVDLLRVPQARQRQRLSAAQAATRGCAGAPVRRVTRAPGELNSLFRRDHMSDKVDALVIFGATGDLAKLETFPARAGLARRGVVDVPVIGVAKSGWGLEQFRDYATASLKLNGMDPADPAAVKMLDLLRYVDGDLGDDGTYKAMSDEIGAGRKVLYYMEVPAQLFGRIAQGIATAERSS